MDPSDELRRLVAQATAGPVVGGEIESALMEVWESLSGDDTSMRAYKLNRIENLHRTEDGCLEFDVERHGAICQGSKSAQVQHWRVDPVAGTKVAYTGTRKRLHPPQTRLDLDHLAAEILSDLDAPEPRWTVQADHGWRVKIGEIIPDMGPKDTVAGRRRRLRGLLAPLLAQRGLAISSRWLIQHAK